MLAEDIKFQERLHGMIAKLTHDPLQHEEFFSNAISHVINKELHEPGHTQSWYVDSCKLHLKNEQKKGVSIDSPKRRHLASRIPDGDHANQPAPKALIAEDPVRSSVCAADAFRQLCLRLDETETKVLLALAEGHGICQIARMLGISRDKVLQCCQLIRSFAFQFHLATP